MESIKRNAIEKLGQLFETDDGENYYSELMIACDFAETVDELGEDEGVALFTAVATDLREAAPAAYDWKGDLEELLGGWTIYRFDPASQTVHFYG